jgi:hypothetical protein
VPTYLHASLGPCDSSQTSETGLRTSAVDDVEWQGEGVQYLGPPVPVGCRSKVGIPLPTRSAIPYDLSQVEAQESPPTPQHAVGSKQLHQGPVYALHAQRPLVALHTFIGEPPEILYGSHQTLFKPDRGLPAERLFCVRDVGLTVKRIVDRQGLEHDLRR